MNVDSGKLTIKKSLTLYDIYRECSSCEKRDDCLEFNGKIKEDKENENQNNK